MTHPEHSSRSAPDKASPEADSAPRILVYGYGNPGRQDDGLGVLLVEELAAWAQSAGRPWLVFDTNYQLNAEDALAAAGREIVIFVDACGDQAEDFRLAALRPAASVSFSTHAMSPESVIAFARELYGANPAAYLLTLKGYGWEPNAAMTAAARKNLDAAKAFITPFLDCPVGMPPLTSPASALPSGSPPPLRDSGSP